MKNLKKYLMMLLAMFLFASLTSCDDDDGISYIDMTPNPPQNVYTITGDNMVDVYWDYSTDPEVDYYRVYWSEDDDQYTFLESTSDNHFTDTEAANGVRTYYAVTAVVDYGGRLYESELSSTLAYSTPRPEGFNYSIFDFVQFPDNSGFDFDQAQVVNFDSDFSDFFFENYEGTFYLNVWMDSDIQDMGATIDIHDIFEAPVGGWSTDIVDIDGYSAKYVQAIVGHTYLVNTWDNHYGKIRVREIRNERIFFDWAYQIAEGNPDLEKKESRQGRNTLKNKKVSVKR